MVFKRSAYSRKGRRRTYRRRFKRRPNIQTLVRRGLGSMTTGQALGYAVKGVNMLKGIVNAEMKRFTNDTSLTPNTTGSIIHLTSVAQGDDVGDRNGNSILGKYLTFNWQTIINSSATATSVRLIVFVDTESTSGTPPSATQLLQSPNNSISPVNVDYTQRFTVLFDDMITMSINGTRVLMRKHYIPLNFHIKYTGSSGTAYDKNQIYLYYVSNEATNTPTVDTYWRLAFYDN